MDRTTPVLEDLAEQIGHLSWVSSEGPRRNGRAPVRHQIGSFNDRKRPKNTADTGFAAARTANRPRCMRESTVGTVSELFTGRE
jgi:hypothetical protein